MGIPYWDYSMKLNNENGNHTLITPILDSNNSIENLIFSYQNKNKKLIVKIINKRSFKKIYQNTGIPPLIVFQQVL